MAASRSQSTTRGGTSYWEVSAQDVSLGELPALDSTLPGTTTASATSGVLTWVSKGNGRAIPYRLEGDRWKPALSAEVRLPHELIAVAGMSKWITLDQSKSKLAVVSVKDEE